MISESAIPGDETRNPRVDHQFLVHVSRELRTPLDAIQQFVSLVHDGLAGELNPEQEQYLGGALRDLEQLRKMIGDLVDVTRADAGQLSVDPRPVDLAELVWDATRSLLASAGERGIALSAVIPGELPRAHADASRVRQVLSNLIENALEFTPEGGAVTVRVSAPESERELLTVAVEDSGCGISRERLERIFEPPHQADTGEPAGRRGLGLGLYLCRELVQRHGGTIDVESELGRGSTVRFTLPVFSLVNLLTPILIEHGELRASYSVIRVALDPIDANASVKLPESLLRSIEEVLRGCVLRDLDLLLPRLARRAAGERFFVVAAADAAGMNALVRRIRRQLGRVRELRQPGVRIRVRGSAREAKWPDHASAEDAVGAIAQEIESLLEDQALWEGP